MNGENQPLVSFVMVAYRQEHFIRDAVEGAFRQTYSPLEIILSDDCSPDGTFEVMQEMAAAYRGPHQVRLNRNAKNLGLCGHINRCMELARGELIVGAAGDDISLPERTGTIVKVWLDSGRKAHSIYSDTMAIDEHGSKLGVNRFTPASFQHDLLRLCRKGKVGVPGCTHAWQKKVFEFFGPINPDVVFEDAVIPLRSRLLGTVAYIAEPLVLQRRCVGSITMPPPDLEVVPGYKSRRTIYADRLMAVYRQWLADFQRAPNPPAGYARVIGAINSKAQFTWAMQQPGFRLRLRAFIAALRHPQNWPHLLQKYPVCAFSCLYDAWIRSRK